MLSVEGIRKTFGGVAAVRDVSFTCRAGEMLAMIGPNGAGKSTCFNMVGGQIRPDQGRIRLGGDDIFGKSPRQIWHLGVGRTFQITETFGSMTVRENLQTALLSCRGKAGRMWRRASSQHVAQADFLLDQVGLAGQSGRPAGVLAYGDLKRLELALALSNAPRLLLMDEPTAGMAPSERVALMELTRRLATDRDIAVLFTEHDMDVVFGVADRIIVLDRGEVIAEGDPETVADDPRVRAVYLGTGATSGGH